MSLRWTLRDQTTCRCVTELLRCGNCNFQSLQFQEWWLTIILPASKLAWFILRFCRQSNLKCYWYFNKILYVCLIQLLSRVQYRLILGKDNILQCSCVFWTVHNSESTSGQVFIVQGNSHTNNLFMSSFGRDSLPGHSMFTACSFRIAKALPWTPLYHKFRVIAWPSVISRCHLLLYWTSVV